MHRYTPISKASPFRSPFSRFAATLSIFLVSFLLILDATVRNRSSFLLAAVSNDSPCNAETATQGRIRDATLVNDFAERRRSSSLQVNNGRQLLPKPACQMYDRSPSQHHHHHMVLFGGGTKGTCSNDTDAAESSKTTQSKTRWKWRWDSPWRRLPCTSFPPSSSSLQNVSWRRPWPLSMASNVSWRRPWQFLSSSSASSSQQHHHSRRSLQMVPVSRLKAIMRIAGYMTPSSASMVFRVVVSIGCIMGVKLVSTGTPLILKEVIDAMEYDDMGAPLYLFLFLAMSRIGAEVLKEVQSLSYDKVLKDATRKMQLDVFSHLLSLGMPFHRNRNAGKILADLERGYRSMQVLFRLVVVYFIPTFLEFAMVSRALFKRMGPKFGAMSVGTILAYVAYTCYVSDLRSQYLAGTIKISQETSSIKHDVLINHETVTGFNNKKHEIGRLNKKLQKREMVATQQTWSLSALNLGQELIYTVGTVMMLHWVSRGIHDGRLTSGDLVLANHMLAQLNRPLDFFGTLYTESKKSIDGLKGLISLLETKPLVKQRRNATELPSPVRGAIELSDIYFKYPENNRTVLNGLSLSIKPGEKVAIVGKTGAGKSTISDLILRHYDPERGSVKIDGVDVKDVQLKSLRDVVGVVSQDMMLFNQDIKYNILYGRPDATDREVEDAANLVGLDKSIQKMANGYKSRVGERGTKLSKGEVQKIVIARMLLKNPKIMIFDEAISSLDEETGNDILGQLKKLSNDKRTSVFITHRLWSIVDVVDKIIVLEDGKIVEQGTHSSLMRNKDGTYSNMWRQQFENTDQSSASSSSSSSSYTSRTKTPTKHPTFVPTRSPTQPPTPSPTNPPTPPPTNPPTPPPSQPPTPPPTNPPTTPPSQPPTPPPTNPPTPPPSQPPTNFPTLSPTDSLTVDDNTHSENQPADDSAAAAAIGAIRSSEYVSIDDDEQTTTHGANNNNNNNHESAVAHGAQPVESSVLSHSPTKSRSRSTSRNRSQTRKRAGAVAAAS